MTNDEYEMLVRAIADGGFDSGEVLKVDGRWHVGGLKVVVDAPVIRLPHWVEGGATGVVIEGEVV